MESVRLATLASCKYTLVFDDRCKVVQKFARIVRLWDHLGIFTLVARENKNEHSQKLIEELDRCPWSLLLLDDLEQRWSGPEAIPIILKNLPFGKLAAVLYIIPGTMWLTHQLYFSISRNRRRMVKSAS